jgi:hypothetical protein
MLFSSENVQKVKVNVKKYPGFVKTLNHEPVPNVYRIAPASGLRRRVVSLKIWQ